MTTPELPNAPERFPDFIVPMDGNQPELSNDEKAEATVAFVGLVDDLFEQYADCVQSKAWLGTAQRQNLQLSLLGKTGFWDVKLGRPVPMEDFSSPQKSSPVLSTRSISLEFNDYDGRSREEYLYTIETGPVTRKDFPDLEADSEQSEEGHLVALEEARLASEAAADGEELEEEMGLYNQPVDKREIEGLTNMFRAYEVVAVIPQQPPR